MKPIKVSSKPDKCPKCGGEFVYFDGSLYVCPDCGHEFEDNNVAATASNDVKIYVNRMRVYEDVIMKNS